MISVGSHVLLVILAVATVGIRTAQGQPYVADLVLCGIVALLLTPAWRRPLVVAALIGVVAVLVLRAPWFGFFTPVTYVLAFRVLPWPWRLAGVAAVAVVAGHAQAYELDLATGWGLGTYAAVVAANVLPLCAFAWYARRSEQRNDERIRALADAREANRRLRETLADNAALHEQVVAQARQAGVHDERQRMAREIHDTLAQGLTGIISQLRAAEHADLPALPTDGPGAGSRAGGDGGRGEAWRRHVAAASGLARESLAEARRSVHALRPEPLETARLGEAVAGVAGRWSALHGIAVRVTATGTALPLHPEAEVALLRSAQEALANVARHARATRVGVTLSYLEGEVALDVRDDGGGFDPEAARGGFGLEAMRQRIESLGGTLQIESEPGGGTGISARVPALPAGAVIA